MARDELGFPFGNGPRSMIMCDALGILNDVARGCKSMR